MKQLEDMNILDILARKEQARKERAQLSFGQKVLIVEAMRKRLAPFKKIREQKIKTAQ
ncbi:hypothetical protein [Rhizobium sp. LjRoot254]|uniref:hypothetical protein n=1 Tax=Rhizobium sp. LjRoot254 TaxID=3342297 RepID=UPI003ECF8B69